MSTRYMFLIYGDESRYADVTPEDWDQMLQAHNAWSASVAAAGAADRERRGAGRVRHLDDRAPDRRRPGRSPTARSSRPRRRSAATTSSTAPTSTRRSRSPSTLPGEIVEVRPVIADRADAERRARRREVVAAVEQAHRTEWGLVLASVARLLDGDLATAEECTQEAFVAALETWGERGIPAKPGAWLTTTARRRALDRVRRESGMRERYPDLVRARGDEPDPAELAEEDAVVVDDRLRLVFTCCHPSLAAESRVALTLRMVCGLSTPEIARAFLVPEATMAARITRAKKKITAAGVPYRVPYGSELPDRLDGVLTVIHLVFTTGYAADGPSLVRADLVDRALDLARVLAVLMPDEPEALGLLALHGAHRRAPRRPHRRRRRPRAARGPGPVAVGPRRRSSTAIGLLDRALLMTRPGHPAGRFTLQAAIAGVARRGAHAGRTPTGW